MARQRVCLPLDGLNSLDEIKALVEELSPYVGLFKIGKETFTRFGPQAVKLVQSYGSDVFLDLKYHDIPNTVKGAARAATQLGVYMFNVHASGGLDMMKAALQGVNEGMKEKLSYNHTNASMQRPKVIAVTVLTSLDTSILNEQLNINGSVEEQVLRLAKLTQKAGLDGIVCSGADLKHIKNQLPADFMFVTPGIKGPHTSAGSDQRRVFTPGNAISDGSSILVIGRAITGAEDRMRAAIEVLDDITQSL
ncbi:orotidine-5'-phosphate decarboxylase [Candidatus Woesearchaeota archaeon]|nr:orotidine-5'-phosphate decarboxylase [Candidatus Woesearchaeota archaeon]